MWLAGLALLVLRVAALPAEESISLHYNERPPYLVSGADGQATGLTAEPAAAAFRRAGIPYAWVQTPALRQLKLLRENTGRDCLVGWFKTAERERYARYTLPTYRDRRIIALTGAGNSRLAEGGRLDAWLADPELTLLVKDGYSYGACSRAATAPAAGALRAAAATLPPGAPGRRTRRRAALHRLQPAGEAGRNRAPGRGDPRLLRANGTVG